MAYRRYAPGDLAQIGAQNVWNAQSRPGLAASLRATQESLSHSLLNRPKASHSGCEMCFILSFIHVCVCVAIYVLYMSVAHIHMSGRQRQSRLMSLPS